MEKLDCYYSQELKDSFKLNYILLILGRIISEIGTSIFKFGLSLYVLDLTNSPLAYSVILGISTMTGVLVNIFAAVISDKYNKKNILVISDLSSGLIIFAFILIYANNYNNLILLSVYVIIISAIQALFELTINAAIPNLFNSEDVAKVNSSIQSVFALLGIFGAIIGSMIYSKFGIMVIFFIDAVSFTITGILEVFLKYKETEIKAGKIEWTGYINSVKESLSLFKNNNILMFLILYIILNSFIFGSMVLLVLPYIVYDVMNLSAFDLSLVQAGWFIGSIVGAIYVSTHKKIQKLMGKFLIFFAIECILLIAWVLPQILFENNLVITFVYMFLICILGIFSSIQTIPITTYFQINIPEDIRGRFFGVYNAGILIASTIGMLVYGLILKSVSWQKVVLVSGVLALIIGGIGSKSKCFKQYIKSI